MVLTNLILSEPPAVRKDGVDSGESLNSTPVNIVSSFLAAALRYADSGYSVFPCAPGQKKPLTAHGLKDASTGRDQIEHWWAESPNANVAIRTDGLLVVDVDGDDDSWLGDQDERWADLARAPSSRTPRGGRHFWFRQPTGKDWRCTTSRLADHVDTRADGGYVVVPPSRVDGNGYGWLEGYELDVGPGQLPEPPAWLVEQLDGIAAKSVTASATCGPTDRIPEGRRNGSLTSFAGTMRRVGLTQAEIAAALHQISTDRCSPPLEKADVDRIAASVARYAPNEIATAIAQGRLEETLAYQIVQPLSVSELASKYPVLREPLIHGLLRRGETLNVIAPPKTGKSWLVNDLALAVTTGGRWLDTFQCEPANVLIIDNELHHETSAQRIPKVADARGIPFDAYANRLFVLNLRGHLRDIFTLGPHFRSFEKGQFQLIVLDAFYRFMPLGMDENDNGTMANLYNHLDQYAEQLGCSFVLIHHSTKGSQAGKAVTDVGAGAGSQSRATDTHLILRPHEELDAVVLEAAVRSWPPLSPLVLRWRFPVWNPAPDLDATALRDARPKRTPKADEGPPAEDDVAAFVSRFITETPQSKSKITRAAAKERISARKAHSLLRTAEEDELVHRWVYGSQKPVRFATVPKPPKEVKCDDESAPVV